MIPSLVNFLAIALYTMGTKTFYFDLAFQLGLRTDLKTWIVRRLFVRSWRAD